MCVMVRTVISLDSAEKAWLDAKSRAERVAMTELVRRAIRRFRQADESASLQGVRAVLAATRGPLDGRGRTRLSAQGAKSLVQAVKILLDSVIVIDHLNGIEQATRY